MGLLPHIAIAAAVDTVWAIGLKQEANIEFTQWWGFGIPFALSLFPIGRVVNAFFFIMGAAYLLDVDLRHTINTFDIRTFWRGLF